MANLSSVVSRYLVLAVFLASFAAFCSANCSNGVEDSDEGGIDCGGVCASHCPCSEDDALTCDKDAYCFYDKDNNDVKTCECPPGLLGDGTSCTSSGWNLRIMTWDSTWTPYDDVDRSTDDSAVAGMLDITCTRGANDGCDHIYYTKHNVSNVIFTGINVLFAGTTNGKAAAEAAAAFFNTAKASFKNVDYNVGARVYKWTAGTTSDPIQVLPSGMNVLSVEFETSCGASGCWVITANFTVGHSDSVTVNQQRGYNTFYLPYAVGSDALSYDYTYNSEVIDTFLPANFPCRVSDFASDTTGDAPTKATMCCFGTPFDVSEVTASGDLTQEGVLGKYRVTNKFKAFAEPLGAPGCATKKPLDHQPGYMQSLEFVGVIPNTDQPYGNTSGWMVPTTPTNFVGFTNSPGITSYKVVDSYVGMYQAVIKIDEVELRTLAGQLRGTVGVEHTVDFFLGYANFKPTPTMVLDSMAMQVAIHVEKTSFFTVSTSGQNDYTFLEYVNLRLITIYNEDKNFADLSTNETTAKFIENNGTSHADYVQVTFTLGDKYEVDTNMPLIPSDSVRAGKGTFFSSAAVQNIMFQPCDQWEKNTFAMKSTFETRLGQNCAPAASMCISPSSIPDHFVSYNIPLGIEYYPPAASDLSQNIFVDMVVSAIVKSDSRNTVVLPTDGGSPYQMKTTLTASIPVVDGGLNIFCDGLVSKTDLQDVANADIVVGSASTAEELTRLRILTDIVGSVLDPAKGPTRIDSDSIESGLMTLVLKGNHSYFAANSGLNAVSLELEDVMTIHIMDSADGTGAGAAAQTYVDNLLAAPGADNSFSNGLDTDGYPLNGAFYFKINRASQRASLEPSAALLQRCPFNPVRPTPGNAPTDTCITRRDVRSRGYPARTGASSTALEICKNVNAATFQGIQCSSYGSSCCTSFEDEVSFMKMIFGNSDYAHDLAMNYTKVIADHYDLNQRYRRAYWINPGYEWTPTQTGGASLFSLSQVMYMFALITLDENVVSFNGATPATFSTPSVFTRRRMLLQSTADNLKQAQASAGGESFAFSVTPQSMMAKAFNVPEDRVATFEIEMQLTADQACMDQMSLQNTLRENLDDYVQGYISPYHSLQVAKVSVALNGVKCPGKRRALRKLLDLSAATATTTMLVVFKQGAASSINMEHLSKMPGVVNAKVLKASNVIDTTVKDTIATPKPDAGSSSSSSSSSSNTALIAGVVGGVGGALVVAVAAFLFVRSRSSDAAMAVPAVQTINVEDLKSQLSPEV